MEELTPTTEQTQGSRPLGLNLGSPECKAGGLTTRSETVSYGQSSTLINKQPRDLSELWQISSRLLGNDSDTKNSIFENMEMK